MTPRLNILLFQDQTFQINTMSLSSEEAVAYRHQFALQVTERAFIIHICLRVLGEVVNLVRALRHLKGNDPWLKLPYRGPICVV
jgi:hypothetical protein